jgi:hypothetical protein
MTAAEDTDEGIDPFLTDAFFHNPEEELAELREKNPVAARFEAKS